MKKELFSKNAKKRLPVLLWSVVRLFLLIGVSYTILYPLFSKISLMFMSPEDLGDLTVKWIPRHFTVDNIVTTIKLMDYWKALAYTAGICLLVSVLQVSICTVTAYGFGRYRSKLRSLLFVLIIATLIIPPQTYIVTLYTQFQHFDFLGLIKLFTGGNSNLLDTVWTVVLLAATGMGIRSALYIYIQRQTFRGLPKELEEAAKVDGAGTFRTFVSVMLPNAIPITVVSFILSFAWQWNDTFYSSHFMASRPLLSLIDVRFLASQYLGGWSTVSSSHANLLSSVGSLLTMIPVLILFVLCQKTFIQSAERSGIVG